MPSPPATAQKFPTLPGPTIATNKFSVTNPQYKKMSFAEMEDRRTKGLCYNCDAKFSPQNKCPNRRLLLLQWDEDLQECFESSLESIPELDHLLTQEFQSLSLHAMDSKLIFGTLRFTGYVNGHAIQVLLDGGSDDNFLQPRVAKFLHLEILPVPTFKVLVGNGNSLQVEGLINNLQITIQKYSSEYGCILATYHGC